MVTFLCDCFRSDVFVQPPVPVIVTYKTRFLNSVRKQRGILKNDHYFQFVAILIPMFLYRLNKTCLGRLLVSAREKSFDLTND